MPIDQFSSFLAYQKLQILFLLLVYSKFYKLAGTYRTAVQKYRKKCGNIVKHGHRLCATHAQSKIKYSQLTFVDR
jgi:hypothetical protein